MGRLEFAYRDIQGCQGIKGSHKGTAAPEDRGEVRPHCPVVTLSQFRFRSANKRGAVAVGGFWWTIQHGFLPFVPDWRYVAWQSLAVARGVLVLIVIYFARTASRL